MDKNAFISYQEKTVMTCAAEDSAVYRLTTESVHGTIAYFPVPAGGAFEEYAQIALRPVPDRGYQLRAGSLSACWTDNESVIVGIAGDTLIMPDHDVTVEAVFEPIAYPILYDLRGGAWKEYESNPDSYTIESGEITLHDPVRSGYCFIGWKGTELAETTSVVKIPAGSTGAREYTAIWRREEIGKLTDV